MNVKICGVQSPEIARETVAAGADFIGFVFARSTRQITVEQAKEISESIPNGVKKVGVFVNEDVSTINDIVKAVPLDVVQLHGDEDATVAERVEAKVIKAIPINELTEDMIESYPANYFLVDSPPKQYRGGSGESFNWDELLKYDFGQKKLILAGGLNEDNIKQAINAVHPFGVDVSSGVETDGKKDIDKIIKFIKLAKER